MLKSLLILPFFLANTALAGDVDPLQFLQQATAHCKKVLNQLDERFLTQPYKIPELLKLLEGERFDQVSTPSVIKPESIADMTDQLNNAELQQKIYTDLGQARLMNEFRRREQIESSRRAILELSEKPAIVAQIRTLLAQLKVDSDNVSSFTPKTAGAQIANLASKKNLLRVGQIFAAARGKIYLMTILPVKFRALGGLTNSVFAVPAWDVGVATQQSLNFYRDVLKVSTQVHALLEGAQSTELQEIRLALFATISPYHRHSLMGLSRTLNQAPKPSPILDAVYGHSSFSLRSTFTAIADNSNSLARVLGALAQLDVDQALVGMDIDNVRMTLFKSASTP